MDSLELQKAYLGFTEFCSMTVILLFLNTFGALLMPILGFVLKQIKAKTADYHFSYQAYLSYQVFYVVPGWLGVYFNYDRLNFTTNFGPPILMKIVIFLATALFLMIY